ncbi:MAG: 30S ribosomal protein S11, partial [bacterium]|nr:30S ribosomal protein S11 [bacterium]
MGKKKIIKQTEEELIKETEGVEAALKKTEEISLAKKVVRGKAYIKVSYNNVLITVTDAKGNAICQSSSGALGFKGPKKSTPFAASRVAEAVVAKVKKTGLEDVAVFVRGIGSGRESAIRSLAPYGLNITSIKDITPAP